MEDAIKGKRVAIIATDGFEQSELQRPMEAMEEQGAICDVIAPKDGEIRGWSEKNWARSIPVDKTFKKVDAREYDALFIPGGALNCDALRMETEAVQFVSKFFEEGKPIGAICHGPQLLIEADVVDGRKITSYPAIKSDLENAGGKWFDKEVIVDQGLVTSRSPKDLDAFIAKLIEEIREGEHAGQRAANS